VSDDCLARELGGVLTDRGGNASTAFIGHEIRQIKSIRHYTIHQPQERTRTFIVELIVGDDLAGHEEPNQEDSGNA
jgi:hypothetical protein